MSFKQLRQIRAHHQGLTASSRASSAAAVIRKLCALQSQERSSAQLAIHARCRDISQVDLRQAREVDRSFVLTWTLRGTLHLVAAEDLDWQLALFGARAIRQTNRRYQQLGLGEDIREKALAAISDVLSQHGALTRPQLAERLAAHGIPVAGQAIHHLVRFAALRGLICFGPECEGKLTYVPLKEWLADVEQAPFSAELLPGLARRYLSAYAPATAADFSRWSGLSAGQANAAFSAIAAECAAVEIAGGKALMRADQPLSTIDQQPTVRFLPRYDNYLLAYHSRDFMVRQAYTKQLHPGGGLIRACVIIDGEAKATWRLEQRRNRARLHVLPFEKLDGSLSPLFEIEAAAIGKFLQKAIDLRIEED